MKQLPLAALFSTSVLCLLISPVVAAEEADSLNTVVVTADRKARSVDETLTPVTIITRKDIEQSHAIELTDILRQVPGITLAGKGGMGKNTSVFLRGTNSNHLLVLVDGIKMGSASLGSASLQDLPLDQVDRIEVVRGPRSSLYGSEAIGGVIQIFTRKGGNGFQPEISVSAGSHNTRAADVNIGGGDKTTWYNLNAGHIQTDGFNACDSISSGCFVYEPDNDGYRRESVSLRAGHRFASGTRVEVSGLNANGSNHFDGFSNNESRFTQQVVSARLQHPLGDKGVLTAQVGQSLDKLENYLNGTPLVAGQGSTYNTRRNTASLQADVAVGQNDSLTFGADQQNDKLDSDKVFTVTSRRNNGVFASYQHSMGTSELELSARHDDNQQFGGHNTGSIALGHELSNGMRVRASYGSAFKAPTFNDLYWPNELFYKGNPNLKPEKSRNAEIGVSGKTAEGSWEVNVFENKVDDLITYVSDPVTWQGTMQNTSRARIRGLELVGKTHLAGWDAAASATIQKPENRTGANAGKLLVLRPQHFMNVSLERGFGKWSVGGNVHAESKRYTDPANTQNGKLPGYATLDLNADYQLARDWTLGMKVGNVLDKQYRTNAGYTEDGTNGLVTLKYAPK